MAKFGEPGAPLLYSTVTWSVIAYTLALAMVMAVSRLAHTG